MSSISVRHALHLLAPVLAVVLAAGCSSYHYASRTDPKADFSAYKTFAWLPHVDSVASSRDSVDYDDDILAARIHDGVARELRDRGLTRSIREPDLLLQYHIGSREVEQHYRAPTYTYYPAPYWSSAYMHAYPRYYYYRDPFVVHNSWQTETVTNGRLAIDAIDRRTGQLVWRGTSSGELPSPDRFDGEIAGIVHNIFKKYP